MRARSILTLSALGVALLALVLFFSVDASDEHNPDAEREAYEAFLSQHPYAARAPMTREELKAIPKADRPDLALEQQVLLTMDPDTRTVPTERLWSANRTATALKREISRSGGALATSEWEDRGPSNVGGRTRALMFDPNDSESKRAWAAGVGGGVWMTEDITDDDASWTPADDFWSNLAVTALAYDPTDTDVFYAGTGEGWFNFDAIRGAGVFKSEDAGASWEALPSTDTPAFRFIQDVLVHSSGDVYVTTREGGLQRSQDGGETWESVLGSSDGASSRAADIEFGADGTIYVSFGIFATGSIWSSESGDEGSWTKISGNSGFPASGVQRIEIAAAPSDENVVYAVTQSTSNGVEGVYRTDNKGETWSEVGFPGHPGDNFRNPGEEPSNGQAWYDLIIRVHPEDPETVFLGTIDVQRSSDGGATWDLITSAYGATGVDNMHPDQHNIIFRPGFADEVVFTHDGGITYVPDGTASASDIDLVDRNLGYNVTQYYAGALSPDDGSNFMLAGAQDNGTQRYFQSGFGFTSEANGGDGAYTHIDQDEPNFAIASSQFGNYRRSTNGGISFGSLFSAGGSFINPSDYDDRENILYAQRNSSSFWRVKNVFGSPQSAPISITLAGSATHFRTSPYAPEGTSTVYIGTISGRMFKVTDAEADEPTITQLTSLPQTGAVSSIDIGRSEDELLVTTSNYGRVSVWESLDGGTSWSNREGDLPDVPVRWGLYHPNAPGVAIVATEAGVWETTDLASPQPTWTPSPSFPTVSTYMLQWRESDNQIMAATHGRGVFTAFWDANVVANEDDSAASPESTTLSAAYPNPFVDRAEFTLTLSEAQPVRVEVYDVRGRRVATLHDGALAASEHRFEIDGAGLAAGTYLVVAEGERFRDEQRVTLVR